MGMLMSLILKLAVVSLCVFGFVYTAQGSIGFNISPSPASFSLIPSLEGKLGPANERKSLIGTFSPTISPPLINGGNEMSPTAHAPYNFSPPTIGVEPQTPTLPPSGASAEMPSPKIAPAIQSRTPIAPVLSPVDLPPRISAQTPQAAEPVMPILTPPVLQVPAASPVDGLSRNSSASAPVITPKSPLITPDPSVSPASTPPSSTDSKNNGIPAAAPTNEEYHSHASSPPSSSRSNHVPLPAPSKSPPHVLSPKISPHKAVRNTYVAPFPAPLTSPPNEKYHSSTSKKPRHVPAPASTHVLSPHASEQPGPVISRSQTHYAPPPFRQASSFVPSKSPHRTSLNHVSPVPSTPLLPASGRSELPGIAPKASPSRSFPPLPLIQALPPPPPNDDCAATICMDPYTNTPPGSPCGCVLPMQIGLRLNVPVYTFFPLVSELAEQIAAGVFMKKSQVRIMGANAATQLPEETVVITDLVPLGSKFDNTTAFLTYQRLWQKKVSIKATIFGNYEVLYVRYPGLPASPPLPPSSMDMIDGGPFAGNQEGSMQKPLGVNVHKKQQNKGFNGGVVAIIVLSASIILILVCTVAWVLLFKHRDKLCQKVFVPQPARSSFPKPSGTVGSITGSGSSTSLSLGSSITTYGGYAKTFSLSDLEKATDKFNASRIIGEGGFGRVYSGVLEDGTKIAVKVLKRDDQQGGLEFLAEVEMLSRLHHRNLVKLIGICTEEQARSLVYELIPNGSVESHLHGVNEGSVPLNWETRIKIALGAARALAYLHEDSSPRVIHRDFKGSNILLEDDFTPKVSDFGLARVAMDEESRHMSTRVMGTFGYVAPEYAMTGHLLVKSDVYSYGVVLLELLTGRRPVDMSRSPGQENLVTWGLPFLTSNEGLESIIDPSLGPDISFDSVAKVAAIASMCVQPEVSNRPFMGEVVQALKLICNECDEARRSCQDDFLIDMENRASNGSGQLTDSFQTEYEKLYYEFGLDHEKGLSTDLFGASERVGRQDCGSFRRFSSSGPLITGKGKQLLEKVRRLYGGSVSEHRFMFRLRPDSS